METQSVKSQPGEDKRWRKSKRDKVRREKMKVRVKVGKSRCTVFFQWFVAVEGRKVTSPTRRVRSQRARGEMNALWREAHFEVKMHQTHHVRTTFGSCDVQKVHAVVARSKFSSHNVQSTPASDHFWCSDYNNFNNYSNYNNDNNYSHTTTTTTTTTSPHLFQLQLQLPYHYTTLQPSLELQVQLHHSYTPTSHYTALRYNYNYTTLHDTTLHSTTRH